jgi:hypothetical protein
MQQPSSTTPPTIAREPLRFLWQQVRCMSGMQATAACMSVIQAMAACMPVTEAAGTWSAALETAGVTALHHDHDHRLLLPAASERVSEKWQYSEDPLQL